MHPQGVVLLFNVGRANQLNVWHPGRNSLFNRNNIRWAVLGRNSTTGHLVQKRRSRKSGPHSQMAFGRKTANNIGMYRPPDAFGILIRPGCRRVLTCYYYVTR